MPAANILPRATAMALGLLYSVAAFAQTSGTTTPGLSTTTPGFTLGPAPSFGSTTPSFGITRLPNNSLAPFPAPRRPA